MKIIIMESIWLQDCFVAKIGLHFAKIGGNQQLQQFDVIEKFNERDERELLDRPLNFKRKYFFWQSLALDLDF